MPNDAEAREHHERLKRAFERCLTAPTEREAYLRELHDEDPALRRELEELLARVDGTRDDPLADRRIAEREGHASWLEVRAPDPETIGPFHVLRRLGEGGMGVVYEAEQEAPRRRVALKLIRPGLAFGEHLRRFRVEAEALGRLQHPGIAQIFDFGTCDLGGGEQPYFVMELVAGAPLLAHAARAGLKRPARLALVAELCDAVQHAHERGVVHRDLKPDNVLVDADGRARVLDFGVARVRTDDMALATVHTAHGQIVGTLTHMAPEQLGGAPDAAGPAVDVYALGVIAFELLTERLPHEVAGLSLTQAARHITEIDPPRLGTLDRSLRGDLETIVAKALDPEPVRRYVTPAAMASDLRRYLASEPIAARPAGPLYRARKFTLRHPGLVATLAVLLIGIAASGFFATRAENNRRAAEWQTYRSALSAASIASRNNEHDLTQRVLGSAPVELRAWEWRYLKNQHGPTSTLLGEPHGPLDGVCIGNSEDIVASATSDGERATLRLVSVPGGELTLECELALTRVSGLAFRKGDRELIVCGTSAAGNLHALRVDRNGGEVLQDTELMSGPISGFAISSGGERVALFQGDHVLVISVDGSQPPLRLPPAWSSSPSFGDEGRLFSCFDYAQKERGLEVYDVETGALVTHYPYRHGFLAPRRARVVTQRTDNVAEAIDLVPTVTVRASTQLHMGEGVSHAAVSGDGNRVLTFYFGKLRMWDMDRGELLGPYGGVIAPPMFLGFLPGGERFVTAGVDGQLRLWPVSSPGTKAFRHASFVYSLALSPDGKLLASGGWDGFVGNSGSLRIWEVAGAVEILRSGKPEEYLHSLAWAKNGEELFVGWIGLEPGSVPRLERMTMKGGARLWSIPLFVSQVVSGPADERVYVSNGAGKLFLLDGGTGRILRHVDLQTQGRGPFSLSPDGLRVVCSGPEHSLQLLDASDLTVLRTQPAHTDSLQGIAHSADGRRVFSASEDGTVRVWDAATLNEIGDPWPHDSGVLCVRPNPSGKRIATGARDGLVRIWSPIGEELVRLEGHTGYVKDLVWSLDGETLYSASGDTTIRVWSTTPRQ